MQNPRSLKVWEKGHQLVLATYRSTAGFPREEQFSLTNQMRRSAVSIPANISEGCGRGTNADFGHFLQIAMGSACELDYYFLLANDLKYFSHEDFAHLTKQVTEVKQMLAALIERVKRRPKTDNTED